MLDWIRSRARKRRIAQDIYGSIVAQARSEAFYRGMGVPDTVMGRLEMIILHTALLIERLQLEGEAGDRLAQDVAEAYVADMDDSIREIGIGDMGVPRRVKQAAAALFERRRELAAVEAEYPGNEAALAAFLGRIVGNGAQVEPAGATALARYIGALRRALAENRLESVAEGRLDLSAAAALALVQDGSAPHARR
ncbi:MAG TPA: ubiquinol-cytochrome C chaperone family protein [Hyphomicrobiaceae bacterium]|nr:ubiquinol-cytochrome C chaperone family protein [Hyphomicrobiaceae bacterium]